MSDLISRQAAIDAIEHRLAEPAYQHEGEDWYTGMNCAESELYDLPSAQPEPLSDAYTKAVWTWLLEYQIKAAELKGIYTPYEVLSWVAND